MARGISSGWVRTKKNIYDIHDESSSSKKTIDNDGNVQVINYMYINHIQ